MQESRRFCNGIYHCCKPHVVKSIRYGMGRRFSCNHYLCHYRHANYGAGCQCSLCTGSGNGVKCILCLYGLLYAWIYMAAGFIHGIYLWIDQYFYYGHKNSQIYHSGNPPQPSKCNWRRNRNFCCVYRFAECRYYPL